MQTKPVAHCSSTIFHPLRAPALRVRESPWSEGLTSHSVSASSVLVVVLAPLIFLRLPFILLLILLRSLGRVFLIAWTLALPADRCRG